MKTVIAPFLLGLAAACANPPPPDAPPAPPTVVHHNSDATSSGAVPGSPDGMAASDNGQPVDGPTAGGNPAPDATPPAAPAPILTDDQIVQVTHLANLGEIDQSKLAQKKAKDARVKKLASMSLKDHQDADTKGQALAKSAGYAATASPVGAALVGDEQGATSTLQAAKGADFDKAYVDAQVKELRGVLTLIDQQLAPNAKSPELRAYLTDLRPKIADRLSDWEKLQQDMAK